MGLSANMRSLPRFLTATLFILTPLHALAETEVSDWLERMGQALHQLNYDGVFIYSHHDHMQSMRIIHGVDEHGERERLISLSGPSREVIRDNDKVTCFMPDDRSVMVEKVNTRRLIPYTIPETTQRINEYYQLSIAGDDRIAGLEARKIAIIPRDKFRYGHNLWLARENGLLLRAEVINEEGEEVEKLMFTNITFYDQLPEQLLMPESEGEGYVWRRMDEAGKDEMAVKFVWVIADMPAGFELKASRRHTMSNRSALVEQQVYSDGLSSLSIFVEPQNDSVKGFIGSSRKGAVNAYARLLDGRRITVVGEVPAVTVRRVAESLYYPEQSP